MFDIGFWEIALIAIVTLLVVGPDRLPEVARTAGRWVLKIRRFVAGVKSDFNRELQTGDLHKILGDQKEQINELRSIVASTRKELEASTSEAVSAAKTQIQSLEEIARGGKSDTDHAVHSDTDVSGDSHVAADPAQDATDYTPGVANTTDSEQATVIAQQNSDEQSTNEVSVQGDGGKRG